MAEGENKLKRFILAQKDTYSTALAEIQRGKKIGHWMWYIFPQLRGLGKSETASYYGIAGLNEAKAYLSQGVLGKRLIEITEELLKLNMGNATSVFGTPDDMKLKSSMTLFSIARPDIVVFKAVLNKFFGGKEDELTKQRLR